MKLQIGLLRKKILHSLNLLALIAFCLSAVALGQNPVEPRREQLLNGLKVLVWSEPKSEKITVKLRVHSGSTFDPAGKSGVMRLLAENLFPDAGTREFFEEELGGSLEVESNYDFIEINASGKASEFERILDIIRTAVITPPIAPDTFKKVLDARLKAAQEESKNPSVIADLEIRKRLFGDFPYGRAENGTPESLAKIAHFDLIGARDKFLTADNSTLVIIGNVREAYAVRAAKQLFGSWRKADKLIPLSFRQPEPVDPKILVVDMPGAGTSEIRLAVRGLARNDKDLMAANFWTGIMEARMRAGMPANLQKRFSLRHTTNALPGIFIISASVPTEKTGETLKSLREQILKAAGEKLNQAEFARNQQAAVQAIKERAAVPGELAGLWFNSDTFKTPNFREVLNMAQTVTISDAERVAARLFKDAPVAVVIIGNAEQIQPQLDGLEAKK